jgi:hypothetical protein
VSPSHTEICACANAETKRAAAKIIFFIFPRI